MKLLLIMLTLLFSGLQYQLWAKPGGLFSIWSLQKNMAAVEVKNTQINQKNRFLMADIHDLQHGYQAIEERARRDLGMIKQGEVFYQVIPSEQ